MYVHENTANTQKTVVSEIEVEGNNHNDEVRDNYSETLIDDKEDDDNSKGTMKTS